MSKYWKITSPISVHVEVTEKCNERCRHCYNFSRLDRFTPHTISMENLKRTMAELVKNKVMHVIITGGEPLLAIEQTLFLTRNALSSGMSVSLNSNLVAANADNMARLKTAGIDHILTTLHSWREEVHDYISSTPGSFKKVVHGIRVAQDNGIRVTVNTIMFEHNAKDIFETGKFVHSLGVTKFLANRTIPSPSNDESLKKEFFVDATQANRLFDDLLRLKNELGMQIGTCRTVPQCHFQSLDRFDDFLARGCAAGKKHLLLNVHGDARACVHESTRYGNIHEIGLRSVWQNMSSWRTFEYIPRECLDCHLFEICDGGCRMVALAHTGSMKGFDNLQRGARHLPAYRGGITAEHLAQASQHRFVVNPAFTYRTEEDFYIVRTLGARVDFIDKELGDILISHHRKSISLTLVHLGVDNLEKMAYFIKRGLLLPS